jgi:hypothetical protein
MFTTQALTLFQTVDSVVYGQFLLVLLGQNLKYGVAVAQAVAHVAVCNLKQQVEQAHMHVKQFA